MKLFFGVISMSDFSLFSYDDQLTAVEISILRQLDNSFDKVKALKLVHINIVVMDYTVTVKKKGRMKH